jgi:myo-inositol-1(or 4)-monophosphatase
MNTSELLEVAIAAAMKAGQQLLDCYDTPLVVSAKESVRDLYSSADKLAEERAISVLRGNNSKVSILAEESGFLGPNVGEDYWIVDALDGTVNYLQHVPFFSVSIAYMSKGETLVSAVYAPLVDDMYYAAKGMGAFKNQRKITTPDRAPEESLFATSFSGKSYDPVNRKNEFIKFGEINDLTRGCLRTGSAALNLAYLAEGRFNGCWGKANKVWDISAGLLLAREAKATVQEIVIPGSIDKLHYLAAAPQNFEFLKSRLMPLFNNSANDAE